MQSGLKFQCYLIWGDPQALRTKTLEIARGHKIDLNKKSPDIFFIAPSKQGISIDEVRSLKKHIFQKPVDLPFKIVIFEDAHRLQHEAQNALLKLLEEPPAQAIIIMETPFRESLLPTILSRVIGQKAIDNKELPQEEPIIEKGLKDLLFSLSKIENPNTWLDGQMNAIYSCLIQEIKKGNGQKAATLKTALEKCIEAKRMINANVNPTFVLANLFFKTHNI